MKAIGIILAGGSNHRMKELTRKRAIPAMPVGGSFRCIDFALSAMSNSHIQTVAVLTQYNARSLNEHLNSSKWWDFGRKQGGLYLFTPTVTADNQDWYRGTADSIYQNIDFLKKHHEPYVIISSGDLVYKMDFNKLLDALEMDPWRPDGEAIHACDGSAWELRQFDKTGKTIRHSGRLGYICGNAVLEQIVSLLPLRDGSSPSGYFGGRGVET